MGSCSRHGDDCTHAAAADLAPQSGHRRSLTPGRGPGHELTGARGQDAAARWPVSPASSAARVRCEAAYVLRSGRAPAARADCRISTVGLSRQDVRPRATGRNPRPSWRTMQISRAQSAHHHPLVTGPIGATKSQTRTQQNQRVLDQVLRGDCKRTSCLKKR